MRDADHDQMMTRYLLGELAPAERAAVGDRLAADPEYFEALCAFEDEALLKWHRGELSDAEKRLFSQSYASSPARRARVASVQDLIEAAEEWKSEEAAAPRERSGVWRWLSTPRPVPRFGVVGTVALLVMTVSLAMWRTSDATRRLQFVERENTALREQLGKAHYLAVLNPLASLGERGQVGGEMNLVQIPREADEIWLQFETADPGPVLALDALLEPLGGTLAARPRPVRVARTATTAFVTVPVAASDLPDGDYVLRLRQAAGFGSTIASRVFRVMRE